MPSAATATITAFNQFGQNEVFTLALGNGQNFFTLTTDAAQFITDVRISSTVGLTDGSDKTLDDLARMFNNHIGWINYYGRFYKSANKSSDFSAAGTA